MLTRSAKRRKIAEDEAAAPKDGDNSESSASVALSTGDSDSSKAVPLLHSITNRNLTLHYMLSNLLASFTEFFDACEKLLELYRKTGLNILEQITREHESRKMPEDWHDREAIRDWLLRTNIEPDPVDELIQGLYAQLRGYIRASGMMRRESHNVGIVMIRYICKVVHWWSFAAMIH